MSAMDPTRPDDGASKWVTPNGLVEVTAPAGKSPYYRLFWGCPRQQTSGGRTFADAWTKALKREALLVSGATPKTERPVLDGIDYWLDPARPTPRGGWGASHRGNMERYAKDYFKPTFGKVQHHNLRRSHFQDAVNLAPTPSEGSNVRRAASSLLKALRQGDYLLDTQVIDLSAVWWHGERQRSPVMTSADLANGDLDDDEKDTSFVPLWSRPSTDKVAALRDAAAATGRPRDGVWWRGLMVELAAYSGPRWSELMAFTTQSVRPDSRKLAVRWRVDYPTGKQPQLALPKMAKRRTTIFPEVSPTGYEVEEQLRRRVEEAEREQAEGTNPLGLLFPSGAGTWMRTGNFHRDIFEKAALAAGWDYQDVVAPYGRGKTREERKWALTWHSLRHTFCTAALETWGLPVTVVSTLAGHSDPQFTMSRYVGASEDAIEAALLATTR
jgi:hypothetical protein